MTRPDISFVVQHLSHFMHAPKKSHYEAALHVVRYIKGQPGLGLLLSRKNQEKLRPFVMLIEQHACFPENLLQV